MDGLYSPAAQTKNNSTIKDVVIDIPSPALSTLVLKNNSRYKITQKYFPSYLKRCIFLLFVALSLFTISAVVVKSNNNYYFLSEEMDQQQNIKPQQSLRRILASDCPPDNYLIDTDGVWSAVNDEFKDGQIGIRSSSYHTFIIGISDNEECTNLQSDTSISIEQHGCGSINICKKTQFASEQFLCQQHIREVHDSRFETKTTFVGKIDLKQCSLELIPESPKNDINCPENYLIDADGKLSTIDSKFMGGEIGIHSDSCYRYEIGISDNTDCTDVQHNTIIEAYRCGTVDICKENTQSGTLAKQQYLCQRVEGDEASIFTYVAEIDLKQCSLELPAPAPAAEVDDDSKEDLESGLQTKNAHPLGKKIPTFVLNDDDDKTQHIIMFNGKIIVENSNSESYDVGISVKEECSNVYRKTSVEANKKKTISVCAAVWQSKSYDANQLLYVCSKKHSKKSKFQMIRDIGVKKFMEERKNEKKKYSYQGTVTVKDSTSCISSNTQ